MACPITLFGSAGQMLVKGCTTNLSPGGAYVPVPKDAVDKVAENVNVAFSILGDAADNRMEGFAANARVLRQEPGDDGVYVGMALQFDRPMHLPIEA